ncbi:peptide synthase [Pseudomonas paralactis]|uniref:Peptide synthase n=1 Tax=Pseudomonas paralactis TaxID=1615673 RepID=A0A0R3AEV6_9PSED|nr:non-ribosomal peptide synthase/polyketide synthase [Pseudomonas paralactis]KRP71474.1 peptide synthase [Pseudomonas paralactis]
MQALIESVGSLSAQQKKALAVMLKQQGINLFEIAPVFKRQEGEPLRLSYAQERQWFLWQLEPQSAAYHVPRALRLSGYLDVAALQRSFDTLVMRHESLRTYLQEDGDSALQVIAEQVRVEVALVDAQEGQLKDLIEAEIAQPFDLQQGPLLRVKLLRLAPEEHVLVLVQHHIVSDGWSMQVMVDELVQLYAAYIQGQDLQLPALPIQYADYALWQRSWMEAGERERQLSYWVDMLGGEQPVLEMPMARPRPAVQSYRGARLDLTLEASLVSALKTLAQREGVTVFMLLLASFQAVLHRYSGQADIRIGVPVANRNRVETERLIGFFVNTQILKADIDGQMTFRELLQQTRQRAVQAQAHQDLPFEQLVEALQPERSLSYNPLFQVMFNHQTDAQRSGGSVKGLHVQGLEWESKTSQFDLNLDTQESAEGIQASLTYATDLFDAPGMQRFLAHWHRLLHLVVQDCNGRVGELPLLDDSQWQQLVRAWNQTHQAFAQDVGVHRLLEAQAQVRPDATALICNGQALSYAELNQRANRLAHRLRAAGVGPDVLVAVALERSVDMVLALLATLKAGGAYVPLDPQFPAERLAFMLEDSRARVLLTAGDLHERLPLAADQQVLFINEQDDARHSSDNLLIELTGEHLAYVIYTSGSTGKPKGVMVLHGALSSFTQGMASTLGIAAQARLLSLTTFSFDIFALELYVPLSVGATVVVADKSVSQDPEAILSLLHDQAINVVQATPSTWRMLLDSERRALLHGVQCLCGGEALPADLAQRMLAQQGTVWNLYGPTETTIWSAAHSLVEPLPFVGRPIANTSLFILNAELTPCPVGVSGELLIGGVGLARGYHGRAALTAERFVPDPFARSGKRLYRTGDLARYHEDGVVEYIGRVDHQVKVRGFRIELGEIEACLREQHAILEAVVMAENDQLLAYLVTHAAISEAEQGALRETLKVALRGALPDYMVPAHMLFLARLPLTPNGKLDRKALPKPDASLLQKRYVAPVGEKARQVAAIWAEVLGVPQVGLEDHFFELGGHSLLATRVVSRVRQALAIDVALKSLFEQPVLGAFVQALGEQGAALAQVTLADREQPLLLSYAQERQWFLWQLEPQSAAYHIPAALRLLGTLDRGALQRAFDTLVQRHETLRTVFFAGPEQTVQRVLEQAVAVIDYQVLGSTDPVRLRAWVEGEIARPFDLQAGPLLRIKLLQLGENEHVLVLVQHHIVSDAWSMQVMVDELVSLYACYSQGLAPTLADLPIQYADYAQWQRTWMEAGEKDRQLAYWRALLDDVQPVLELPLDRPRPAMQSYQGARLDLVLEPSVVEGLRALAQREGVTMFMLLLASFQSLLYRYTGQSDIRVGVPIANRNRLETEQLIGFFVNTQVLKAQIDGHMTFARLLQQVKEQALGAQAHQDLPFEQLVEALQPERSLSHNPLFQVMFNHQSAADANRDSQQLPGLCVEGLAWDSHTAHFDLSLDTEETAEGLLASLTYATALFDASTLHRFAAHWQNLLHSVVSGAHVCVADLPILSGREQAQILCEWNPPQPTRAACNSVLDKFEQQVASQPEAIALIMDQRRMSYADLNLRANRLAHKLIEQGVSADGLVGVAVDRSLEMIVALLAVLKAGGAYVPLDPQYPQDRLQCMIEDSGLQLLLTQQALLERLPISTGLALICLEPDQEWLAEYPSTDPAVRAFSSNLAYLMFTSGSTGRPKGVGIDQGSLARHVEVFIELFELTAADRVLQFGTFNFDGFVEQLYPALCCGAAVVVRGGELWDSDTFYTQLIEHDISVVDLTTAYWHLIARDFAERGVRDYGRLRQVHAGGEAMPPEGLASWRDAGLGHVRLFNTYGPTEATVTVTALDCAGYVDGSEAVTQMMPIGRVLDGRAIYLLDASLNPVPVGVAGELVIGGPLLARGYFNRAALTAERFIPDPFDPAGGRLYRTGDLARYRADGVIEYIGRIDHQVKVRGFRIELGEIESRLLAQDCVREALVIAADQQLIAYLVTHQPQAELAALREQIRASLGDELPDYMVPAHFMFLERLPLSPNGKLDRHALPRPQVSQAARQWVAPVSELEQQVAAIWADILGVERIGLGDHFFELGGHSLLAMQVASRLRHNLGIELPLRVLFEQPRLEGFVAALHTEGKRGGAAAPALVPASRDLPLVLSYAQERQWFLWLLDPENAAYHVPSALRLKGQLDLPALQRSFDAIVARHESLRTHLHQGDEQTVQVILPQARVEIALVHSDQAQVKAQVEAEIARPFNLQAGPLLRATLLRLSDDEHVLVLVQHHIVSDGWSMQIMVDELVQLYSAYSQGHDLQLPALPIQYADYARWQREWMDAGEKERQLAYWQDLLGGEQPVLELPLDHQRPAEQSHRGARLLVELPPALVSELKGLAQREGVTMFMLLLASFQALMHRYSGQEDVRVGVPIANRNRVETERLLGFFVNTQVLKADIDAQTSVLQLLQQVRRRALQAQDHQDLPFEQLVEALQPERSLSLNPLFQVMFNHQTEARLGGNEHQLSALRVEGLEWESQTAHFDLDLDVHEGTDGIWATLGYATDLFNASTIERMARHWQNLLQGMVTHPQQSIGHLNLLDPAERQQILQLWDRTASGFSARQLVHELFAERAWQNPEAVAVKFDAQILTYGELDRQANRLAHALIARGVGPEVRVAIAMPRSAEIMVAFLAVMKAGGVYVPLDVEYPRDRLLYMMQDSRAKLLLTHSAVQQQLPIAEGLDSLAIDDLKAWVHYRDVAPRVQLHGDNLAYVIYTSGSTGLPKGVAVSHGPLVAHIIATGERYETSPADCELHFMSFAFDGSHEGWMHPLINGASVLIRDDSLWLPEYTYEQMHRHNVTMAVFPPVYLQQLAEHAERDGNPPAVRVYCFGGDAVAQASYDLAWRALKPKYLFNGYGPTETVVTPLLWKARKGDPCGAVYAPIGTLLGNRSGYVLDAQLNLQPIGVAGELYLGGEGVARGYLERPALTAERFVPDPFGKPGSRVYRSGDLTRGRPDGVVDYLGRVDHQVKIRGFRIELGEIEARLREQENVGETVVVAQEGPTGKQLVAYVVPADASLANQTEFRESLRRALKNRLPDYMVPTYFMFLAQMPLTPNGKLDRKGLPQPDVSLLQQAYVAPQSELELRLAAIWADVLRLPQVGLNDNFFELGGDSIISIQVVSRARQAGIRFTPKDLFLHQTVQSLAGVARQGVEGPGISQAALSGETMLLPIQQTFFSDDICERHHWNQSVVLQPHEHLEAATLTQALQALLVHHDALRLQFIQGAGGWQGVYRSADQHQADAVLWQRAVHDIDAFTTLGEEAQRSLDLTHGPLMRAVLAQLGDGSQRLLLVIHHLVVDGVSWRILLEDLQTAYRQLACGAAVVLPGKTSSARDWALRLQQHAQSEALTLELEGWQTRLQGAETDLPGARPGASLSNRHAASATTHLDATHTRRLLQEAPAAYRTQINDLLLTALARVIGRWTGHASTLIRLEGHGREDLFDDVDLTRTVGWFTSIYPVKLTPAQTLEDSLKGIKEQLRAIPDKGLGFGALRFLGPAPVREVLARLPQPRITFNYLGQFDTSFEGAQEQGFFAPSGDAAGADQSPEASLGNWLEINGQVYGGELNLTWSFSQDMFEPQSIQALADAYSDELKALIEHCCQPESVGATPSDFPLAHLSQAQLDGLVLPLNRVEDIYPLSPMQQGMLFQSLYGQGSGDYINQMRVDVQGLDVARFQAAWQVAVEHHAILRTAFIWQTELGQPLQVVYKSVRVPLVEHDWQHRVDRLEALDALAQSARTEGFVLEQAPLLSLVVVRTGADTHHLIYTNHHILMDGWSASQLFGEVMQYYAGESPRAPNGRYRDYIAWLQAQDPATSETFWKAQLVGLQEPTRLSRGRRHEQAVAQVNGIHRLSLGQAATEQLKAFAQGHKVTLNTLVQSAWLLLLQRHTGLDTVAFGATVAGRPAELAGIEQQVGLFINTLPVIAAPSPQLSVDTWLQQVQAQNLRLREQEHTPLFDIQRWAGLAGEALFDSILVFENYPVSEALEQGAPAGLHFGAMDSLEQTHYPLTVLLAMGDSLAVEFNYDHAAFGEQDIAHLAEHFQQLLQALTLAHVKRLADLPSLPDAQRKLIVDDWNATAREYPLHRGVHELIEYQVALTPDAPALAFGAQRLSYSQLNCRANRLAHRLVEAGVGPDVLVGLAVERSIDMVVGLLAVLKAGGAYVPLDPEYPRERLAYMLADSGVKLLLTQAHLHEQLPIPHGVQTLVLGEGGVETYSEANPGVTLDGENLAYVIYTSGSTGQPKGAGNRHCALTNRLCWMQQAYALEVGDTVLQKTPFSFDVSVWEFFWPLMTGARLVIAAPGDHRDPGKLIELINREQVTTLHFVPSMLQAFLLDTKVSSCTSLQRIVCSGEALPVDAQQQVFAKLPQAGLYNLYGPTEAAIDVTHWTCLDEGRDAVPIGKPIANLGCYVLDSHFEPVPAGVLGELFLGGVGLARGYHRRPGLTAERFIAHPFIQGERLYRTGDLARYRADGVIEYAGRIDHQVKLRGLRIELGEIEARLLEHDWVREAAVLAVDDKHLVGYLVLQEQGDDWREVISAHLAVHLPDYMVPAQWLVVDQMPLGPNGKLDRRALPKPDTQSTWRFEAPQTELEQKIAAIWSDVLSVESVGLNDNFFELGGHSLLVLMLKERIRKASGIGLSVSQLMLNPTVRAQVGCLQGTTRRSLLVPLNGCTQGTPLYLFHPSYGSVHCYKAVALALREQRPVVGVICRALAEEGAEVPSWSEMIEDYTGQLLEAQPEGAFHLAGWSLGGNLAVEVAYGLEQAGRQVEFVGWIDASPPRWLTRYWDAAVTTDDSEVCDNERRVALLGEMFPAFAEAIHTTWQAVQVTRVDQGEQWAHFLEWAEATLGEAFGDIKQELLAGSEAQVSWEVDRALFKRMEQADFKPLKAPVSCWWAAMSRAGQHKALIEASMERTIGGACVVRSVMIDVDHERIIDNAEFVRSFVTAME